MNSRTIGWKLLNSINVRLDRRTFSLGATRAVLSSEVGDIILLRQGMREVNHFPLQCF